MLAASLLYTIASLTTTKRRWGWMVYGDAGGGAFSILHVHYYYRERQSVFLNKIDDENCKKVDEAQSLS